MNQSVLGQPQRACRMASGIRRGAVVDEDLRKLVICVRWCRTPRSTEHHPSSRGGTLEHDRLDRARRSGPLEPQNSGIVLAYASAQPFPVGWTPELPVGAIAFHAHA